MIWNASTAMHQPSPRRNGASTGTTSGSAMKITTFSIVAVMIIYFVSMQKMFFASAGDSAVGVNDARAALHKVLTSTATATLPPQLPKSARNWTRSPGRRYVWIDVAVDNVPAGRIVAELYMDKVPKTAENFRGLVTGDNQHGWSYKNSTCHRILKGFIVQCGSYNAQGGTSIYGKDFEDEATGLTLKHSKRGILQMANAGPNTNGAQFCFMLGPAKHLNGHHVVFGEVVQGLEVLDTMEAAGVATDDNQLVHKVALVDGGEIFD
ncbi:hypothetical protein H310_05603 [Aphanomyces invadans]|uniref:Peptidyl-prolyl cis-trans isomerase n=1 Tax=Aphanomyces invadans TaxID=157072 RepID=A0A024U9U4_9STRA|nr:hypothetical protein H310_05603 [Aphanomyces invadans]ETW03196.1 hypothetical protein H310_05603 [Aphanomyces invadans]|eukprot:XP_008868580.1 hypothetical protein H310_05603 [Aphanomyces invadans]